MKEIWKDIEGYEGYYKISNCGNVYSCNRQLQLSQLKKKSGYLKVNLHKKGEAKTFSVHRLVALAFLPNPDNLPEVNHIDANKLNNNACNLEWCSHGDNMEHAFKTGLCKRNEPKTKKKKGHGVKLTKEQVIAIRNEHQKNTRGFGCKSLAKKYKVSETTIKKILNHKTWKENILCV